TLRGTAAPAAEKADVRNLFGMGKSNLPCLHPAHREARHGTVGLIRKGAEVGIDERDQIVNKHAFESAEIKAAASAGSAARSSAGDIAVGHDDEEWLGLSAGDE